MDTIKHRIGIMGGTFDPVHNAHLALARQAYEQFQLDSIWMLPNGNPPHKKDSYQEDVSHRTRMLELAIQGIPYLKLCDMESSGDEFHYTYETLLRLHQSFPKTRFYFILGADSLFDFEQWKEPGIISRECVLLAAVRDHCQRESIQKQILLLKERYGAEIRLLDTPNMDIASSLIRQRLKAGADISDMVPPMVTDYIRKHGLYQTM